MGKLVQVATTTVTSAVASVTLTGIDSDDVYMVAINNIKMAADKVVFFRFTESGTPNTTTNYDRAHKLLYSAKAFANVSATNQNIAYFDASRLESGGGHNGIIYIYNANNSSEYTFYTHEISAELENAQGSGVTGAQGGGVFTVTSAVDGLEFTLESATNFTSGTFTLYKVL